MAGYYGAKKNPIQVNFKRPTVATLVNALWRSQYKFSVFLEIVNGSRVLICRGTKVASIVRRDITMESSLYLNLLRPSGGGRLGDGKNYLWNPIDRLYETAAVTESWRHPHLYSNNLRYRLWACVMLGVAASFDRCRATIIFSRINFTENHGTVDMATALYVVASSFLWRSDEPPDNVCLKIHLITDYLDRHLLMFRGYQLRTHAAHKIQCCWRGVMTTLHFDCPVLDPLSLFLGKTQLLSGSVGILTVTSTEPYINWNGQAPLGTPTDICDCAVELIGMCQSSPMPASIMDQYAYLFPTLTFVTPPCGTYAMALFNFLPQDLVMYVLPWLRTVTICTTHPDNLRPIRIPLLPGISGHNYYGGIRRFALTSGQHYVLHETVLNEILICSLCGPP